MRSAPETDLVIGSDGFLGRHLAAMLTARGRSVHRISRTDGDLSDWPTVERLLRTAPPASRIFHLVTRQRTGQVQYGIQGELLAINTRIHLNILEAWRLFQRQAKLISTGSSCVYPESDRPLVESTFQTSPMHPSVRGYGLAKQLLAEGSATYAAQYGLKYLHLVLATVFGPGDHKQPDRSHFMGGMIDRAVREMRSGAHEFTVWGDPGTVRDLLYVDDQLEAMLAADSAFENCLLNCSSNRPVTIGEAAQAVVRALSWDADVVYPPNSFKGTSYKSLDASRFLEATRWQPGVALQEGVRRVLQTDYGLTNEAAGAQAAPSGIVGHG
jgi:GDP-L-fucose synthase